jgi:hypothetical protein
MAQFTKRESRCLLTAFHFVWVPEPREIDLFLSAGEEGRDGFRGFAESRYDIGLAGRADFDPTRQARTARNRWVREQSRFGIDVAHDVAEFSRNSITMSIAEMPWYTRMSTIVSRPQQVSDFMRQGVARAIIAAVSALIDHAIG